MKIILIVIVCWLSILTILGIKFSRRYEENIEREIARQLSARERRFVDSYADKLERIQKDLGMPTSKKPETIEDMVNVLSKIVLLPDPRIENE